MILYLVRHGQSVYNTKNLYQGRIDNPLTPLGKEQAKQVAQYFKNINDFDVIYSSGLMRALHTAQEIHKHHKDKPLIIDNRLMERSHGVFENKPKTPNLYDTLPGDDYWLKKPRGGENYHDIIFRIKRVLSMIVDTNQNALVVTHGVVLRAILHLLLKTPRQKHFSKDYQPGNCSVFKLKIQDHKVELLKEGRLSPFKKP